MSTVSVLLIDDNATFTRFAVRFIEAEAQFDIVGVAQNARDGLSLAETHRPDAILLDLAMPDVNGLEAIPMLQQAVPKSKIVVLSMHDGIEYSNKALSLGASGFVSKKAMVQELVPLLNDLLS